MGTKVKQDPSKVRNNGSTKERKVNGRGKDVHVHAMKAYQSTDVTDSFLTSAVDEAEWSVPRFGGFTPEERACK